MLHDLRLAWCSFPIRQFSRSCSQLGFTSFHCKARSRRVPVTSFQSSNISPAVRARKIGYRHGLNDANSLPLVESPESPCHVCFFFRQTMTTPSFRCRSPLATAHPDALLLLRRFSFLLACRAGSPISPLGPLETPFWHRDNNCRRPSMLVKAAGLDPAVKS